MPVADGPTKPEPPISGGLVFSTSFSCEISGILAMTVVKKSVAACAIVLLAGAVIDQITRQADGGMKALRETTDSSKRKRKEEGSLAERLAKSRDEKPTIDRKAELERLKIVWMENDANKGIITEEHQKLARETAGLLLCGREALELVVFLEANERLIAADVVRDGISAYLASRDDPEARMMLIEMSGENREEMAALRGDPLAWKTAASQRHQLLAEWSKAAGRSCSPETLEELRAGLKDGDFAQEALIGYNSQLMRTDPEAAVTAMVYALQLAHSQLMHSPSGAESIKRLFHEELPPEIDFAKLESLLPAKTTLGDWRPGDDPYRNGREELFRTWAKTDPAAAANHVIAHPDRLGAELMESIVGAYYYQNPNGVVAWISQFPPGPYFDAAAHSAAIYARATSPVETRELIMRIGDPEIREDALRRLAVPSTNPHTR